MIPHFDFYKSFFRLLLFNGRVLSNNDWGSATWDFQQCGICDQQSLRSVCAYAQSDQSLCWSLEYSTSVKLLTGYHLRFLSLKGGCTGLSESTLVKMPHCWKSHVMAQFIIILYRMWYFIADRSITNSEERLLPFEILWEKDMFFPSSVFYTISLKMKWIKSKKKKKKTITHFLGGRCQGCAEVS